MGQEEPASEERSRRMIEAVINLAFERLGETLEKLVERNTRLLEGRWLGGQVASFYKTLIESGVPEKLAAELTKIYLEKAMEKISDLASIVKAVMHGEPRPTTVSIAPGAGALKLPAELAGKTGIVLHIGSSAKNKQGGEKED